MVTVVIIIVTHCTGYVDSIKVTVYFTLTETSVSAFVAQGTLFVSS